MEVDERSTHDALWVAALIAELAATWEMPGADSFTRARQAAISGDRAAFVTAASAALCANASSAGHGYDIARHLCELAAAQGERDRSRCVSDMDVSGVHQSFLLAHLGHLQRVAPRPLPAALRFWSDGMSPPDALWAADTITAITH